MTDKYAVIGSPIAHSLSPRIHAAFATQTGQQMEYSALEVTPDTFLDRIKTLEESGYKGVNVTVPLKELAWETADACNDEANRAQAVNTLKFEGEGLRYGCNTDGIGLLQDLSVNHGLAIKGQRILILGAGGAVRGVLAPLLHAIPALITVANRTAHKAEHLAELFDDLGSIRGCGLAELGGERYNLIINGTSAGLSGSVPELPAGILAAGGIVYDMMYGKKAAAFLHWGQAQGARLAIDGLGMLVEQAAEAFRIWRGVKPETQAVLKMLRSES
jgi:shikimate dehydrogenase